MLLQGVGGLESLSNCPFGKEYGVHLTVRLTYSVQMPGTCRHLRFRGPFLNVSWIGSLEKSHLRLRTRGYYRKADEKLGFIFSSSGRNEEKDRN